VYSAFLDLANLARRYGASAGVFVDALGDMMDQLQECISASTETGGHSREGLLGITAGGNGGVKILTPDAPSVPDREHL
jgi:hypothetical protein